MTRHDLFSAEAFQLGFFDGISDDYAVVFRLTEAVTVTERTVAAV